MKVLVTGGGGYLGQQVVRRLLNEGDDVRALVRRPPGRAAGSSPSVEWAVGDVRDPALLDEACSGVDAVAHLVAILREGPGAQAGGGEKEATAPATYASVNVGGTQSVVEAARRAGVRRFVHMSAIGAKDDPRLRYVHSKWLGEQVVAKSGLDYMIVRSSVMFGPGFGFLSRLMQSIRMSPPPVVPLPAGGKTLFQPISTADAARCVVAALEGHGGPGPILEIGGPEHLTYRQILERVMEATGARRTPVAVPMGLMKVAVPVMGLLWSDPPVTAEELAQLPFDNVTDIDAVERAFGFKPEAMRADALGYLREE